MQGKAWGLRASILNGRPSLPFQARVTVAAMVTSVAVLLAALAAFGADQWRRDGQHQIARYDLALHLITTSPRLVEAAAKGEATPLIQDVVRKATPRGGSTYITGANGRLLVRAGAEQAPTGSGFTVIERSIGPADAPVGRLTLYAPRPPLLVGVQRYLPLALGLLLGASLLSLMLGRLLARRVTHPIDRLSAAMLAVAESGDMSQRVDQVGDDELGRLTASFNALLERLHEKGLKLSQTMDELVHARDAAEAANLSKSQFLANMSHEIRTPLNGLLAMSQVMALNEMSDAQRERLEVVRQSGEALLAILNDVLDVSKIEAGKLELDDIDFDVETAAGAVHAAFAAVAHRKGVQLSLKVAPDARGLRRGDAQRLRQILSNLVSNALKFTPAGQVGIEVAGEGEGGAEGLRITVADTGIGIAPDVAPLLFQKFTQADSSTTRRFGGTGLGLAICSELAQLMGGRIWLESALGEGSTFHLTLPLPRVAAPAANAAVSAPAVHAPRGVVRVLAAEDNPTNQLVLKTVLGIFGAEVELVDNGRKAVEAWAAGDFDVVLMDIQMPEMDGLEATRLIRAQELRERRVRTPIVALSAHAMTHQVREYLEAGVDLHVPKPIELPRLQAALEQAVAQREAARAAA